MTKRVLQQTVAENEMRDAESSCSDNEINENMELNTKTLENYNAEQTYYPEYVFDNDIKASPTSETNPIKSALEQPTFEQTSRPFRNTCCKCHFFINLK